MGSSCEDTKKTLFTILRGKGHPHALLSTRVLISRLISEVLWLQLNKLEGLAGRLSSTTSSLRVTCALTNIMCSNLRVADDSPSSPMTAAVACFSTARLERFNVSFASNLSRGGAGFLQNLSG